MIKEETRGRPRKDAEVKTEKNKVEDVDNQLNQVLSNHEQRIQQLEAAMFRLRSI